MKSLIAATLTIVLPANTALALSCLRPDVVRSYQMAAEASESYVVVSGVLDHQMAEVPTDRKEGNAPVSFAAQLVGKHLTADGFTGDFSRPVEVTLNCVSVWCATLPPQHSSVLAYVRMEGDQFFIDANPCQTWLFDDPTPDQMVSVVACHTEGNCQAE